MSNKACLSNSELEMTQRMQMHFPAGVLPAEVVSFWNSCPKETLTSAIVEKFGKIPKSLLEFLNTVTVPDVEQFIAKEKFVINTSNSATKISYLGDMFRKEFLDKVENGFAGSELCCHKLLKASVDGPIIDELGGEVKAETTLAEVFSLMEKQPNGENGALLNNGWWNIFYVRNGKGVLRAVYVYWYGVGWLVNAYSVEYPGRWHADDQVFSRNS